MTTPTTTTTTRPFSVSSNDNKNNHKPFGWMPRRCNNNACVVLLLCVVVILQVARLLQVTEQEHHHHLHTAVDPPVWTPPPAWWTTPNPVTANRSKNLVVFDALGRREAIQYSWFHKRQHFAHWDCIAFLYVDESIVPEDDYHLRQLQQPTEHDSTACAVIRTPNVAWGVFLQYLAPPLVQQYQLLPSCWMIFSCQRLDPIQSAFPNCWSRWKSTICPPFPPA